MTTPIHTCPSCGLRFPTVSELVDHTRSDHLRGDAPEETPTWGQITVPIDPAVDSTTTVLIASMLARQAGMAVALMAAPAGGLDASAAEGALRTHAGKAKDAGAPLTAWHLLPAGDIAESILDVASEGDATLLCMATHSRGAAAEMVLGSVSEHVARRAAVPVVLVGPHAKPPVEPYSHVMVAYDGSDEADHALEAAGALAPRLGADIVVVQVLDPDLQLPEDVFETNAVRRAAARLPASRTSWEVVHDTHPDRGLVGAASSLPNALILIGTRGHKGLRRLAEGSISLEVTRKAFSPVMVVGGATTP